MPSRCCVPNCDTYYSGQPKRSKFRFPKDEKRQALWVKSIPREDYVVNEHSRICIEHFCEGHIIRTDKIKGEDGAWVICKKSLPKLSNDAFPSIFQDYSQYKSHNSNPEANQKTLLRKRGGLSKESPTKSKKRCLKEVHQDEVVLSEPLKKDIIQDFKSFSKNVINHLNSLWLIRQARSNNGDYFSLYLITATSPNKPVLSTAIRVYQDMSIDVHTVQNSICL